MARANNPWRLIIVGGHTRTIGKTQLVCDIIAAFPQARWIAGKITQYGHGVCAQNGHDCDCAPDEHVCAISWEQSANTGTDSSRFLAAGAQRSFWLRTKQGFLAEGLPILRGALDEVLAAENANDSENADKPIALVVESNSLMHFVKPTLFFAVLAPAKEDFKDSARAALDRADALVIRGNAITAGSEPLPLSGLVMIDVRSPGIAVSVNPCEGDPLPEPLEVLVRRALEAVPGVAL